MTPEQIRKLRESLCMTQTEFAAAVGVAFATVNRWENGHNRPLPVALRQLDLLRDRVANTLGKKG